MEACQWHPLLTGRTQMPTRVWPGPLHHTTSLHRSSEIRSWVASCGWALEKGKDRMGWTPQEDGPQPLVFQEMQLSIVAPCELWGFESQPCHVPSLSSLYFLLCRPGGR